jgi:ribosome-binding protein aMBF1 (putative translation factor)
MNSKNWKEGKLEDLVAKLPPESQMRYHELTAVHDAARALLAARKLKGLTQTELAKLMGTTQAQVHRLENATPKSNPSIDTLNRAAKALNLELIISFRKAKTKTKANHHAGL